MERENSLAGDGAEITSVGEGGALTESQFPLGDWEKIVNGLPVSILVLDKEGRVLYAGESMNTCISGQIVGRKILELAPEDQRYKFEDALDKVLGNAETVSFEVKMSGEENTGSWCSCILGPLEGYGAILVKRDITERTQMETRFRTLYESSSDAIMMLNGDGFFDCNPRTLTLFGVGSVKAFCALHPANISPAVQADGTDSMTAANKRIATAMREGSNRFEWLHKRLDTGEVFPAEVFLTAMDIDGKQVLQASVRDISDRKRIEESLRDSEEKFRTIADSALDAVIMLDNEGKVNFWNSSAERIFGYTAEEIRGKPLHDILTPKKYHEAFRTGFAKFQNTGKGAAIGEVLELSALRRDGTEFPIEISLAAVKVAGKWNAVGIIRDITERKKADAELRKFKLISDNANVGAVIFDLQGNIEYVNDYFADVHGYRAEELLGCNLSIFHTKEQLEEVDEINKSLLKDGRYAPLEVWHARKDGTVFPMLMTAIVIDFENKNDSRIAATAIDITELKNTEKALKKAMHAAEEANRAKSTFLANMSHEIRTPMNGVIGMTELLLDTRLDSEQRDYVETIRSSGESLLAIINDILDFSKIDADKLDLEVLDFDLRSSIEDLMDLLAIRAHKKELEFACLIHHNVPNGLRGDPVRLRQVLMNLINNAIKFTEQGEVVIRVKLVEETMKKAVLEFAVSDTGIGLPEDKMHRLFKPFSQMNASTTRKYGGTGLGLAISKRLVEMMGGKIRVESKEGEGTTFFFTAVFEKQPSTREKSRILPKALNDLHVLIVDDNATNRRILLEHLNGWGCRPEAVPDGFTALDMLHDAKRAGNPFQLAILDMQMPGMDGEQLGREIKTDEKIKDTVLIMMTSVGIRGDISRLEEIGFSAYLNKPVKRVVLYKCLLASMVKEEVEEDTDSTIITKFALSSNDAATCRVLLAEDNPVNQKVAVMLLKKIGIAPDIAVNGREAIDAIRAGHYDLVLMDVQMPEMDGYEATQAIRSGKAGKDNSNIPIIAMTAHAMSGDRERCLEAGMNDYLSKPVTLAALKKVIPQYLSGHDEVKQKTPADAGVDDSSPGFDANRIKELMGDDAEGIREFVGIFIEEGRRQVEQLKSALDAGDLEKICARAHRIKGSAREIGGNRVGEIAEKLEFAAGNGDAGTCGMLGPGLINSLEQLLVKLEKYLLDH